MIMQQDGFVHALVAEKRDAVKRMKMILYERG